MKGARKYAELLKSGRYGKLKIISFEHARGKAFHVFLIIEDKEVEVYGVVAGDPGWSESYGWIHKGKWCKDFNNLVLQQKNKRLKEKYMKKKEEDEFKRLHSKEIERLLQLY